MILIPCQNQRGDLGHRGLAKQYGVDADSNGMALTRLTMAILTGRVHQQQLIQACDGRLNDPGPPSKTT